MNISSFSGFSTNLSLETLQDMQNQEIQELDQQQQECHAFMHAHFPGTLRGSNPTELQKEYDFFSPSEHLPELQQKIQAVFASCEKLFQTTAQLAYKSLIGQRSPNPLSQKALQVHKEEVCEKAIGILEKARSIFPPRRNATDETDYLHLERINSHFLAQEMSQTRSFISVFEIILKTQKIEFLLKKAEAAQMSRPLQEQLKTLKSNVQKIQNAATAALIGNHDDNKIWTLESTYKHLELEYESFKKLFEGKDNLSDLFEKLHVRPIIDATENHYSTYNRSREFLMGTLPQSSWGFLSSEQKTKLQNNATVICREVNHYSQSLILWSHQNLEDNVKYLSYEQGVLNIVPSIMSVYEQTKPLRQHILSILKTLSKMHPGSAEIKKCKEDFQIFSAHFKIKKLHDLLLQRYMLELSCQEDIEGKRPRDEKVESFIKSLIEPLESRALRLQTQFRKQELEQLLCDIKKAKQKAKPFLTT